MPFREATSAGTKALIGLYGGSGSGKTLSALLMARGLVGIDGNVLMIDTESRRGEIYHDVIPGGYLVEPVEAPFSPSKFSEIISKATLMAKETKKETALIIDSMSHSWESIGGVIWMAEEIARKRAEKYGEWNGSVNFGDWKKPKTEHRHMVLQMLGCPLHIIVCLRADFKSRQIDKKDYEKFGIDPKTKTKSVVVRDETQTPIQDSKLIYEFTVNIELSNENPGLPILRKCPQMLLNAFPQGQKLSIDTGKAIVSWINDDAVETEEDIILLKEGEDMATFGLSAYQDWFRGKSPDDQKTLFQKYRDKHEKFKAAAVTADLES